MISGMGVGASVGSTKNIAVTGGMPIVFKRLFFWVVFAVLIVGIIDTSWAVRSSARTFRHRPASTKKAVLKRAMLRESLTLPHGGELTSPDGSFAPGLRAAAAILVDANSGAVLYEHLADLPLPPASVTKILTALVILEQGRLDDIVVVSRLAAQTGGYRLGLRAGQRISLGDLLAAVLIRSANDAAVAAGEHVGGGLAGFVALMNEKASQLGMVNSHFANPHGLDEPMHYTTARDLAVLTRVALENPTFATLVRSRQVRLTVWSQGRRSLVPQARFVQSHNRLLGQVAGADGVKTGYTDSAGRCLVASASRGDQRMIAVLLNDPHRWNDAAMLLEYGFGSRRDTARTPFDEQLWNVGNIRGDVRTEVHARSEERP